MSLRPRSVRVRLTFGYACALALILAGSSLAVFLVVRANLLHEVEERAEQELAGVQRELVERTFTEEELETYKFDERIAIGGRGSAVFASKPWKTDGLPDPSGWESTPGSRRWESPEGKRYMIVVANVQNGGGTRPLFVAVDEGDVFEHLRTLGWVLLLLFPVAIAAALVGGWWLTGRLLAPVGAMADVAARIHADRLGDRLPIQDPHDEFGRLASAFNGTLARLEDAFARLQRFTTDASHELRTPLTALRSVGEVALQSPRFHEVSRETIVSMLEESRRLTELIDGLLLLTRESGEAYRLRFVPIDVREICGEVVELLRVLAEEKEQRLELDVDGALCVRGDRAVLRHSILNLADNAIRYTPRGGLIRVRARGAGDSEVQVEVADDGPGISPEHRDKVFERFYRIDPDRSRASGGAGLGLAIVRWAAELHGGRVALDSTPRTGSTFRLTLPRA